MPHWELKQFMFKNIMNEIKYESEEIDNHLILKAGHVLHKVLLEYFQKAKLPRIYRLELN